MKKDNETKIINVEIITEKMLKINLKRNGIHQSMYYTFDEEKGYGIIGIEMLKNSPDYQELLEMTKEVLLKAFQSKDRVKLITSGFPLPKKP